MKLTDFEFKVVHKIVKREAPWLSDMVEKLRVSERQDNGVGRFIKFCMPEQHSDAVGTFTLGGRLYADIGGIESGAGFMLYVDHGSISELEVFGHGNETIPEQIEFFNLYYL